MNYQIVAPIERFDIANIVNCKFSSKYPIVPGDYLYPMLNSDFRRQIGFNNELLIRDNYCFVLKLPNVPAEIPIYQVGGKCLHDLSFYITMLWFLKDGNSFVNRAFIQRLDDGLVNESFHAYSNFDSQDTCDVTTYDVINNSYHEILNKILAIWTFPKSSVDLLVKNGANATSRRFSINYVQYSHSRILRALIFLMNIRNDGMIIGKISSTMVLYECLFTANESQIGKTIRRRLSAFIGGNKRERGHIKNLLLQAYQIRSRYLHGDIIQSEHDVSIDISKQLDTLTRKVLTKIINMNEGNIFTLDNSQESKIKFVDYFNKLTNTHFVDSGLSKYVTPIEKGKIIPQDEYDDGPY